MKSNPKELFDNYLSIIISGLALSSDQIIKLEYLKKVLEIDL
jgi:hypothetical protein